MFNVMTSQQVTKNIRKLRHLKTRNTQEGIALFQVLLITAVITILAIQFTQTARNQLSIASMLSDRVLALSEMKTVEAELLFSLLTEKNQKDSQSTNVYVNNWNFYGEPFKLTSAALPDSKTDRQSADNIINKVSYPFEIKDAKGQTTIQISIQDLSGLVSIYQGRGVTQLKKLLTTLQEQANDNQSQQNSALNNISSDFSNINPSIMVNSLADWQDEDEITWIYGDEKEDYNLPGMPTNLPLQTIEELKQIRGFNSKIVEVLKPYLTIRPQRFFNPMLSPLKVMELYMPKDRAVEITRLRKLSRIKQRQFETISGLPIDEGMSLFNSGQLKVVLEVNINDVHLKYEIELLLQPYEKLPYIVYEIKI
ncbi:general secretion pathway protein GspK [Shewanella frigidimarina]